MLGKEDFGLRIKKARELYGKKVGVLLTQAALARKIGVSRVYINDLEAGRNYPSLEVLQNLTSALDINLGFFDSVPLEENEIPEELKKLGIQYLSVAQELKEKGLSPEEIRKLAEIAEMFKKK
jgi:transcriptional regulator with XRE-family HTH domain